MNVLVEPDVHDIFARIPCLHGKVDFVACLGRDGVIMHASNLFRDTVEKSLLMEIGWAPHCFPFPRCLNSKFTLSVRGSPSHLYNILLVQDFMSMLHKTSGRIGACMTMLSRNCYSF